MRIPADCFLMSVVGLALTVSPTAADVLVTTDGAKIETDGGWSVQGRQVVFTDARGTLSSLRLDDVDLEASREASLASAEPTVETPRESPVDIGGAAEAARLARERSAEPVATLTDDDVTRVDPEVIARLAAAERPSVVLYATSWCPWCKKARSLFGALGVSYTERDIERDTAAAMEMARKAGIGAGVPVVDVGGRIVRGYDPERIIAALTEASQASSE